VRRDWQVGVDVGGTFTDGVLVRPGAEPLAAKSLTDSADPLAGLRSCLDRLATGAGVDRGGLLRRTSKLAYGTTLAANALVEGKVARTGFITTRGFRDTLVIAGIGRERIGHDLTASRPPSLVPRRLILEVRERVDALGRVVAPLRHDDVRAAMAVLQDEGVEAVGVCLLWSFLNRAHELELAEALRSQIRTASVRLRARSLSIAVEIRFRTDPSDRCRVRAISATDAPLVVARSTSRSRGVSGLAPVCRAAAARPGSMTRCPRAQRRMACARAPVDASFTTKPATPDRRRPRPRRNPTTGPVRGARACSGRWVIRSDGGTGRG
jgi:hydantoinase/oxoprolinase-like protein